VKPIDIKFYKCLISEYDIACANISILAEQGKISKKMYNTLKEADKQERNEVIGVLERDDKSLYTSITNGIDNAVDIFINKNKIKPDQILERNHDAVFVMGRSDIKNTDFGEFIKFNEKNTYYMLIDFPAGEDSGKRVKLYKTLDGVAVRYGKLNTEHLAYKCLLELMSFKLNGLTKKYFKRLAEFDKILQELPNDAENRLINTCANTRLIEVFKELA